MNTLQTAGMQAARMLRAHAGKALLLLAVLGLGYRLGVDRVLGPQIALLEVTPRDWVQTIVASGHVEAPHRVTVGSSLVGRVSRVPVETGQHVQQGQVLIELDATEAQALALQADRAVQQAQARLRQLREVQAPLATQSLRQAQLTREHARLQLQRNQDLFGKGFLGQAALDEAQKALDLADSQVRAAQTQWESAQPQGSDYALAASALAQAQAAAEAARTRLRDTTVRAPAAGVLIRRDVEPGDVVQPGKTLMLLSPAGPTQLVVQMDEKNLQRLALGQPAQASADAYADQRFAAEVVFIDPAVTLQNGTVEVKLGVNNPPAYLRQDMTVSVNIQVASRRQALLLPLDAVHEPDSAQPWVLRFDSGHARRQNLRLGLRSAGQVEVLQGLQAGDRVLPGQAPVREGEHLRPLQAPARSVPSAQLAPPFAPSPLTRG